MKTILRCKPASYAITKGLKTNGNLKLTCLIHASRVSHLSLQEQVAKATEVVCKVTLIRLLMGTRKLLINLYWMTVKYKKNPIFIMIIMMLITKLLKLMIDW